MERILYLSLSCPSVSAPTIGPRQVSKVGQQGCECSAFHWRRNWERATGDGGIIVSGNSKSRQSQGRNAAGARCPQWMPRKLSPARNGPAPKRGKPRPPIRRTRPWGIWGTAPRALCGGITQSPSHGLFFRSTNDAGPSTRQIGARTRLSEKRKLGSTSESFRAGLLIGLCGSVALTWAAGADMLPWGVGGEGRIVTWR